MEELVTNPLEDAIAEIAEVDTMKSKSMVGVSIIEVTAEDRITDIDQVWDEVRAKVLPVQPTLPRGVQAPFVFSDFGDVYPVCFALYQSPMSDSETIEKPYSRRQLGIFAEKLEEELELINSVARVDVWGVQPERIYSADWAKLGLTLNQLRTLFEARNIVDPGGELDTNRGRYAVNPTGEFTSVEQLNDLVVDKLLVLGTIFIAFLASLTSLFGGALWAPMTNGMIFGLIFATVLTLVVVPTLYVLFAERFGMKVL